jgi:hypothetical protein
MNAWCDSFINLAYSFDAAPMYMELNWATGSIEESLVIFSIGFSGLNLFFWLFIVIFFKFSFCVVKDKLLVELSFIWGGMADHVT